MTLIISDWLCFIGLTFYLYRLSEYRLKSHIGATLLGFTFCGGKGFSFADHQIEYATASF